MGSWKRVGHDWKIKHNFLLQGLLGVVFIFFEKTLKSQGSALGLFRRIQMFSLLCLSSLEYFSYISLLSVSPSLFFLSFVPSFFFLSFPPIFIPVCAEFYFCYTGQYSAKAQGNSCINFCTSFYIIRFLRKFCTTLRCIIIPELHLWY